MLLQKTKSGQALHRPPQTPDEWSAEDTVDQLKRYSKAFFLLIVSSRTDISGLGDAECCVDATSAEPQIFWALIYATTKAVPLRKTSQLT
jgi:hypothetical protein